MRYKEFILDDFQVKSIESIEKNNSVVVSAATGTGKTLIADYVIDKAIKEGKKVFYTAPIKALSNQKYKDFKNEYGEEKIGIMTGDVVINPEAQVIVMTTEIYRNMLMVKDPIVDELSFIVFDEIHFINDIERGTVWEESIIFSPNHVRFLCLSATIPNAREFADWIASIKKHTVDVVEYLKRAVPLKHYAFDNKLGICAPKDLEKDMELDSYPDYSQLRGKRRRRRQKKKQSEAASHIELVREIADDGTPAIFFTFSRKACEIKAKELSRNFNLTTNKEKQRIVSVFKSTVTDDIKNMISTQRLRRVIGKGIAFHHAGMLPKLKEAVEILFGEGLIKVLYATETFAVGINMPAKTVCFNTLQKYDGISFRYLFSKEYFQMAGRAGRRGIDKVGTSIVLIDRSKDDIDKIIRVTTKDVEPIKSQFKLSINTVINLVDNYEQDKVDIILKSNFDYYLRTKDNKNVRIMATWKNKIKLLKKLGYINEEGKLTWKGGFARHIYSNELLVSEIFGTGLVDSLSEKEIILILCAIAYEPRRGKIFYKPKRRQDFAVKVWEKIKRNKYVERNLNTNSLNSLSGLVLEWLSGSEFRDLMQYSNLDEGDIIRIFRQAIDMMRQIKHSCQSVEQKQFMSRCIGMIDRDVVRVEF